MDKRYNKRQGPKKILITGGAGDILIRKKGVRSTLCTEIPVSLRVEKLEIPTVISVSVYLPACVCVCVSLSHTHIHTQRVFV